MAKKEFARLFSVNQVVVEINPDTLKPEETIVYFTQRFKKYTNTAEIKLKGDVLSNDGFSSDEIESWKAYVRQYKAAILKIVRES